MIAGGAPDGSQTSHFWGALLLFPSTRDTPQHQLAVKCLAALMNNAHGLKFVLSHPNSLKVLSSEKAALQGAVKPPAIGCPAARRSQLPQRRSHIPRSGYLPQP